LLRHILLLLLLISLIFGYDRPVLAKGRLTLIRDAEIEHTIQLYATPILQAAGLNTEAVNVHIIRNDSLNAFVAGGQRIFLFTGLLLRVDSPNQLKGVIAHEIGHITGGHLARTQDALQNASATSIISMILGVAAIVAGGGQAGAAILAGGQHAAQRSFLQYSRTQEGAADQAGLKYLTASGQSGKGLLEFLEILGDQEALMTSRQDPYVRSHPISSDRVSSMEVRAKASPYYDKTDGPESIVLFDRMQAKLFGYLKSKSRTMRKFPKSDDSVPARYARAISYSRVPQFEESLMEVDSLVAESSEDPFFHELKGEILFSAGELDEALPSYATAVRLLPQSVLIRLGLAQVQIATEDPELNAQALQHLETIVRIDPSSPAVWRQLAIAYGRAGRLGESVVATAERMYLSGDMKGALQQARRAQKKLPEGSADWLRAQDIENSAEKEIQRRQ